MTSRITTLVGAATCFLAVTWLGGCVGEGPATGAPAEPLPEETSVKVAIPNARSPFEDMLTGGQPTREHLEQAAAAGFRTIVNLRTEAEEGLPDEAAIVSGLGMRYVHIPVAGAAGLTDENVRRLTDTLTDPETGPVVVHCKSGNRVGALLALKAAMIDGASADEAMSLGKSAGLTRLEEATRKILDGLETSNGTD